MIIKIYSFLFHSWEILRKKQKNWNTDDKLKDLLLEFGEDLDEVRESIKSNEKSLIEEIEMNQLDQKEAGHHGVPLNVYKGKYYFGQDDPFEELINELINDEVIKDFKWRY